MHLWISFCTSSLVCFVSKIPGVSTITIFRLNLTAEFCEHIRIIDDPDRLELNLLNPRMVFPVALFPDPVFPSSTSLTSLSIGIILLKR